MGFKKSVNSRRHFLKSAAVVAGTAHSYSWFKSSQVPLFAAEKSDGELPWYGVGIDIKKCIGCGRCTNACKNENHVPRELFYFRTWIEHYTIKNDGEVTVESPNGGIDGFQQSVTEEEIFKAFFVPKMCNQCYKSPCVQVCPVGATFDSPEGVVLVDDKQSIGYRYCVQACPYGYPYIHQERKVVDKCTLCYHRIKKGLDPACVETCPTGARIYGNLNDPDSELVQFLKENTTRVLKPHLNTGSKLYYNALSEEINLR